MCRTLTSLLQTHKATSEMTTSEMTTSETSKTSEKRYQSSACVCGPKNCETKRARAPVPKSSNSPKSSNTQEMCRSLRYTSETQETNETKHEASGCACGPHELRTRDREP